MHFWKAWKFGLWIHRANTNTLTPNPTIPFFFSSPPKKGGGGGDWRRQIVTKLWQENWTSPKWLYLQCHSDLNGWAEHQFYSNMPGKATYDTGHELKPTQANRKIIFYISECRIRPLMFHSSANPDQSCLDCEHVAWERTAEESNLTSSIHIVSRQSSH